MNIIVGLIVLCIGCSAGWWFPALFPVLLATQPSLCFAITMAISVVFGWLAGTIVVG